MSLTIHLSELGEVGGGWGFHLFRLTDEDIAKWKERMMKVGEIPLCCCFREELFYKVNLFLPTSNITLTYFPS
jgi:hypothetical protein